MKPDLTTTVRFEINGTRPKWRRGTLTSNRSRSPRSDGPDALPPPRDLGPPQRRDPHGGAPPWSSNPANPCPNSQIETRYTVLRSKRNGLGFSYLCLSCAELGPRHDAAPRRCSSDDAKSTTLRGPDHQIEDCYAFLVRSRSSLTTSRTSSGVASTSRRRRTRAWARLWVFCARAILRRLARAEDGRRRVFLCPHFPRETRSNRNRIPEITVLRRGRFSRVCYGGGRRVWRPGPARQRVTQRAREVKAADKRDPHVGASFRCGLRGWEAGAGRNDGLAAHEAFILFSFLFFFLFSFFISKFGLNLNFKFEHCIDFYPPIIL
jgi:hypothetical protein